MESKLPLYNLMNALITGLVFIGSCAYLFWDNVKQFLIDIRVINITGFEALISLVAVALAYETGYLIFRLGAMLEPVIKMISCREPYPDFVNAEKEYSKLTDLSREYGYVRTHLTLSLLVVIIGISKASLWMTGICLMSLVIFAVSLFSHTARINSVVKRYIDENQTDKMKDMVATNLKKKHLPKSKHKKGISI